MNDKQQPYELCGGSGYLKSNTLEVEGDCPNGCQAKNEICELCGKEIVEPNEVMYPHGHHGEPVVCLNCYTTGIDMIGDARDGMESL